MSGLDMFRLYGDLLDGKDLTFLFRSSNLKAVRAQASILKRKHFESGNVKFYIADSSGEVLYETNLTGYRFVWLEVKDLNMVDVALNRLMDLKNCCNSGTLSVGISREGMFTVSCPSSNCPACCCSDTLDDLKNFWNNAILSDVA